MKKAPSSQDLVIAYEKVKDILSKHSSDKFYENRETIRKEIERQLGSRMDYWWAVQGYLNKAKLNFDPDVKNAFWDVFHEFLSGLNEVDAACHGLEIEGAYDMVLHDMLENWDDDNQDNKEVAFNWVKAIISRAKHDAKPVLIIGDTGTGKEAMARILHKLSNKKREAYGVMNCAAIPGTLLESELFGIVRNYPGFHNRNGLTGKLKLFENGTLFLDEIGKTSVQIQAKLLRAIENGECFELGGDKPVKINTRVIVAAQRQDLEGGSFLPDLKYRLGYPYVIELPPLNDRLAKYHGISNWAQSLMDRTLKLVLDDMGKRDEISKFKISDASYELLVGYNYKGNYRELRNILTAAVDLALWCKRKTLLPMDFALLSDRKTNEDATPTYEDIKSKDIFLHADEVKASIVAAKIKEVIDSGRDVKSVLANEYAQEGLTLSNSQYVQYTKKVGNVTGKKISAFKKS